MTIDRELDRLDGARIIEKVTYTQQLDSSLDPLFLKVMGKSGCVSLRGGKISPFKARATLAGVMRFPYAALPAAIYIMSQGEVI